MSDALVDLVFALGDDELVIGHRHSEWTGFAPHLEEDVAFSSIAQDEIGHAANYYALIGAIIGDDRDHLALGRPKDAYRHAVICERQNGDWAYTVARHWIYDNADEIRLQTLEDSSHPDLASLAVKIRREERYHLMHADHWMRRVASGPVEGRTKLIDCLSNAFADAAGLFEPTELEDECVKEGWLPVPSGELHARFVTRAGAALDELGLPTHIQARLNDSAEFVASSSGDLIARGGEGDGGGGEGESDGVEAPPRTGGSGGRRGVHTQDFDQLWDDMTFTYRSHPGATW